MRSTPLTHTGGFGQTLFFLHLSWFVLLKTTPGHSGLLVDPGEIDLRFQRAWLPFFSRNTMGNADVDEFPRDVGEWLPTLEEISPPLLSGKMLCDAVHAKSPSAGDSDWWGWNDFGALSLGWFDGLAEILVLVEESGTLPEHLLDAYIVVIPKEGGNATPIGCCPAVSFSEMV